MKYRVGTRESKLAVTQAQLVCKKIVESNPNLSLDNFELVKIKTIGDKVLHKNLSDIGGKNLFVRELEQALLEGKIDFAVHSLKDMTAKLDSKLIIAACLEREDPRDAFISPQCKSLKELPKEALIGTSSIRRKYMALHLRPDLIILPFRGNVQTRLDKLSDKQVDGTFLAVAGLKRLGIDENIYNPIEMDDFLPAISQGVIGVQARINDHLTKNLLETINHLDTYICNQAERGFLESLDADCNAPIAAYAKLENDSIILKSLVINSSGEFYRDSIVGAKHDAWKLGFEAGIRLKEFL